MDTIELHKIWLDKEIVKERKKERQKLKKYRRELKRKMMNGLK